MVGCYRTTLYGASLAGRGCGARSRAARFGEARTHRALRINFRPLLEGEVIDSTTSARRG